MKLFPALTILTLLLTACSPSNPGSDATATAGTLASALTVSTSTTTTSAQPSKTVTPVGPVVQEFEYPQSNGAYMKVVCSHGGEINRRIELKYELTAKNLGSGTYKVEGLQKGGEGHIEPDGRIPSAAIQQVSLDEFVTITIKTTRYDNSAEPFRYRGCTEVS